MGIKAAGSDDGHPTMTCGRSSRRSWRRRPAFAASAILVLGLGLGASTALFAALERGLFRPLPYTEPATRRTGPIWRTMRRLVLRNDAVESRARGRRERPAGGA